MRPSSCGSWPSLSDGTCGVGITSRWVGAWGLMSRNAISPSPRFTIVAGISPAATLQKRQADMGPLPSERLADLLPELLAAALLRRRLRLDHGEPLQQLLLLPVSFVGVQTRTRTCRSPRPPSPSRGRPLPRMRYTVPVCVPGWTLSSAGPYGVGISTSPPSAA